MQLNPAVRRAARKAAPWLVVDVVLLAAVIYYIL